MKNDLPLELQELYKAAEHFAHDLAYIDHQEGPISLEGIEYKVIKIASHYGFTSYVFKPITPGHTDIKITFRGASDFASFLALIQSKGPGHETFEKMRPAVLDAVNRTIAEVSQSNLGAPITVSAYGHSMGGGMSQYFITAVLREIVNIKKSSYQHYRQIKNLNMRVFSSTGVDAATELEAGQWAQKLYQMKMNMKKTPQQELPILDLKWFLGAGDGFQRAGDASILSNVASEIASVSLVKAHHKEGAEGLWNTFINFSQFYKALLNALKVHTGFYFSENHNRGRLEYYTNDSPLDRERIDEELSNKSTTLKSVLLKAPQHILHKMIHGIYHLGRKVKSETPRFSPPSTFLRYGFFSGVVKQIQKTGSAAFSNVQEYAASMERPLRTFKAKSFLKG